MNEEELIGEQRAINLMERMKLLKGISDASRAERLKEIMAARQVMYEGKVKK